MAVTLFIIGGAAAGAEQLRVSSALGRETSVRVTLLGHASVLVEMAGGACLMDPVFFDPFEEGAVVSGPARVVHPERIPAIDILIVSHRHPDHFDIASLDCLPRDCDAICPADPLIVYGLRRLGFMRIHPVDAIAFGQWGSAIIRLRRAHRGRTATSSASSDRFGAKASITWSCSTKRICVAF